MVSQTEQLPHKLTLNDRKNLTLTGVTEIVSFDDTTIILQTHLGALEVQGQSLQLKTLSIDGGQVIVSGHISTLIYDEPRAAGGFWGRLFR